MEAGGAALALRDMLVRRGFLDVMDAWPETLLLAARRFPGGKVIGRCLLTPYARQFRRYCREVDGICAQSEGFADYARAQGAPVRPEIFYLGGG